MKTERDPLTIIREMKTIRSEKLLTEAYKNMRLTTLENELMAAQKMPAEQGTLDLKPPAKTPAK